MFAFPKPDDIIRDYLTGEEEEYGRFFHAAFKAIGSVLEEKEGEFYKMSTGTSKVDSRQRFGTWWADHLSTRGTREGTYKRIMDEINGTVCTLKTYSVSSSVPSRIYNVSNGEKFRDAFRDTTWRFTHFITMSSRSNGGDHCPWTSIVWAAFVRGAAIIGKDTMDFMIPLTGKVNKIGESTITAIIIQVKNQIRGGQRNKYLIDAEAVALFPKDTRRSS